MLKTYFPLVVEFLIAGGFVATMIALAIVLGPSKHTAIKDDPFECGTVGTGSATGRFGVKFYLVAVIFILFDVEVVFLYPWAVKAVELGWAGFWAVVSFLCVVALGLAYVWKRGVLDWS